MAMVKQPCAARHALEIPHVLDLVLRFIAQDCLELVVDPCRLVCKGWDEASVRQLVGDQRVLITDAEHSARFAVRSQRPRELLLDGILQSRPWLLSTIKSAHLLAGDGACSAPLAVGVLFETLLQCSTLQSLSLGSDLPVIRSDYIPSTTTRVAFCLSRCEDEILAWLDVLLSLPQLSELCVRCGHGSPANQRLARLLAAMQGRLVNFQLWLFSSRDTEITKTMYSIEPLLQHFPRLTIVCLNAAPPMILDVLPSGLQDFALHATLLDRAFILRLADPSFLPAIGRVPDLGRAPHPWEDLPVTKAEVRAAIEGLARRGTVRDMHTAGFTLYPFASDLSEGDRARMHACEVEGTAFEPID